MRGLPGKPRDRCLFFLAASDREPREKLPRQPNNPDSQAGQYWSICPDCCGREEAAPALPQPHPKASTCPPCQAECAGSRRSCTHRASLHLCWVWAEQLPHRKMSQTCCWNSYHTARHTHTFLLWLQGLPLLDQLVEVSEFNPQEWLMKAITT